MRILGIIYRGLRWFFRLNAFTQLGGVVMGFSFLGILSNFNVWLQSLPPVLNVVFWLIVVVLLFLVVISLIGFFDRKKSPPVTLSQAADHIIHNTLGGLLILKKKKSGLKYAWKEIYYRAEAGEIEVFGTLPNGKVEKIPSNIWSEKLFGFTPSREEIFKTITYGNKVWDSPRILESELFRYWPPIPFLVTYRKIKNFLERRFNV